MKEFYAFLSMMLIISISYGQRLQTPTLSPYTKITQEVGLTEIGLEYARPSAKGRTIFGSLVPFDKIWRTGANASSKITITESVHIGGQKLEAGTYALYTIPGKEEWTVIVHGNTKLRSLAGDGYKPENDIFRFQVKPARTTDFVETFTMQFAALKSNSVQLQLMWEHTIVSIPVEVEVDQKIENQLAEMMQTPDKVPHRTYFEAAQYYLNNGKDLDKTLGFIDTALEKSQNNFRYGLLKSKILYKRGEHKAALVAVNEAHEWAKKAQNANYME
ncbi:MAG: DUF2911 domain-containing protein, partial [Bacteroidia bacterium]|nr:DUF2911 domain-containing protein [Bacteroidia bacterium]